ncbi:MAG: FecR domain-containing protein [Mucilaginibacter sp.]|uniref:FecR family protein n=1 Tax=Mucilaginibacter sp. TaxID=1882438 RepID=UPI00319EBF46
MNWETLLNYVNGESHADEAKEVLDWAGEQTEHRYLLTYLQRRKQQLNYPLKQSDIDEQWLHLLNRIFELPASENKRGFQKYYRLTGIAASLLLFCFLGWLFVKNPENGINSTTQTLQSAQNAGGRLTLPDGTQVFMTPNSKITYTNSFNAEKRELTLTGEAFFDVKHDAHKPFIIRTNNHLAVTVLGTSFNVYSRPKANIEVKVATGLVGITANNKSHFLKAGQQLIYKLNSGQITIKQVNTQDASSLQNQTLVFNDNNADEIAEKLQRWYNINVEVNPSARKRARFSGEMKDTGIDNLLQGLSYATGLKYRYKNPHTVIIF